MKFDFVDQVVLVTGGSRGIGKDVSQMFADAGAKVVVNYRSNRQAAEMTRTALSGDGHMIIQADMGNAAQLEEMVSGIVDRYGRIDVLVNNAGIYIEHAIQSSTFEKWQADWQAILNVNLIGAANLIYLVSKPMRAQGGGRIVNVSSRGAFRGEPFAPAYGASKAGMNGMGQSLAQALAPDNIFIHTVAPGFVETDMAKEVLSGPRGDEIRSQSPLGRVAKPEEVAQAVLYCAAKGTEFMTGSILDVNGASYLRQ
ncbi:MAG: SDR family oxidoreductase [Chloroflexota bacterium]